MKTRHLCDEEREEIAVGKITCLIVLAVFVLSFFVWGCKTPDLPDIDIPDIITPTTTTTTLPPVTTTTQPPEVEDSDENNIVPEQQYPPRFDTIGATELQFKGGLKYNAENSRKKLKIIWPSKYINKIAWCVAFGDGYQEVIKRAFPNEGGPRARFYGSLISKLPQEIICRAHIVEDGVAKDIWVRIPDTKRTWQ